MNVKNPSIASGVEFVGAGVLIAIGALIEFVKSFMRLENSSLSSNCGFFFFLFTAEHIPDVEEPDEAWGRGNRFSRWLLLLLVVTVVSRH